MGPVVDSSAVGAYDSHAKKLLRECARYAAQGPYGHPLSAPGFIIDQGDVTQIYEGVERGLIQFKNQGRFDTLDRPTSRGHWSLLSFYKSQTIVNGEYIPQLAGYVELISTESSRSLKSRSHGRLRRLTAWLCSGFDTPPNSRNNQYKCATRV